MDKFQVISLFPIPIGKFNFPRKFKKSELQHVKNLKTYNNVGNHRSVDSYILKHKEMQKISMFIEKCINAYFLNVFKPHSEISLYITQSWANYSKKNEWHHMHHHPNSYISGVIYLSSDADTDSITFYKTDTHVWKYLSHETTEFNQYNSDSWNFPAVVGTLYLFPSSLPHSVSPVQAENERISISFNTFLKGKLGSELKLTELILE